MKPGTDKPKEKQQLPSVRALIDSELTEEAKIALDSMRRVVLSRRTAPPMRLPEHHYVRFA